MNELIEYNIYMSIIEFIDNNKDINLSKSGSIEVLPSYPRDLTNFTKPSIILQKIHADTSSVGMGNTLGQYEVDGVLVDAKGIIYDILYQIDIIADNNTEKLKISSFISNLLYRTVLSRDQYVVDNIEIALKDFVVNIGEVIGRIDLIGDIQSFDTEVGINNDYRTTMRLVLESVQKIIPQYDIVDLTKPLKWNQTINL